MGASAEWIDVNQLFDVSRSCRCREVWSRCLLWFSLLIVDKNIVTRKILSVICDSRSKVDSHTRSIISLGFFDRVHHHIKSILLFRSIQSSSKVSRFYSHYGFIRLYHRRVHRYDFHVRLCWWKRVGSGERVRASFPRQTPPSQRNLQQGKMHFSISKGVRLCVLEFISIGMKSCLC